MRQQFYRMSLLSKQAGHANMFSEFLKNAFSQKPPASKPDGNTFQGKPIPEGFKASADGSKLELTEGYEYEANDQTKARKKSQDNTLTSFEGMFKMDGQAGTEDDAPAFALDPEKLKTLTGNLNFAPQLTPELLAKLKEGDPQATTDLLNSVGRNAYATLMQHLPALTGKYVDARLAHSQKGLGKSVKSTLTKQSLSKLAEGNPILAEQLDGISSRLLSKFPDADPDWLAEQTKQYFISVVQSMGVKLDDGTGGTTKDKPDPTDLSQKEGFDWGTYVANSPSATKK